jgi:hypothetical protein
MRRSWTGGIGTPWSALPSNADSSGGELIVSFRNTGSGRRPAAAAFVFCAGIAMASTSPAAAINSYNATPAPERLTAFFTLP